MGYELTHEDALNLLLMYQKDNARLREDLRITYPNKETVCSCCNVNKPTLCDECVENTGTKRISY